MNWLWWGLFYVGLILIVSIMARYAGEHIASRLEDDDDDN